MLAPGGGVMSPGESQPIMPSWMAPAPIVTMIGLAPIRPTSAPWIAKMAVPANNVPTIAATTP